MPNPSFSISSPERARTTTEAPLPLTRAYVHLIFAYGLARLGQSDKARALADAATTPLDLNDPVHGFLVRAYRARVATRPHRAGA